MCVGGGEEGGRGDWMIVEQWCLEVSRATLMPQIQHNHRQIKHATTPPFLSLSSLSSACPSCFVKAPPYVSFPPSLPPPEYHLTLPATLPPVSAKWSLILDSRALAIVISFLWLCVCGEGVVDEWGMWNAKALCVLVRRKRERRTRLLQHPDSPLAHLTACASAPFCIY